MALAGWLPTRTTASPGGRPLSSNATTRGFSSFLMSSRTRFPSRIRGILLNHNLRRSRAVPVDRRGGLELGGQALGGGPRSRAFQLLVQFGRDLEELAIPRLPDLQKRPRVQPAFYRTALVQLLFERL